MKKINSILIILTMVLSFGCEQMVENNQTPEWYNDNPKDVEKAIEAVRTVCVDISLEWLNDIISKAEEDRVLKTYQGNYLGIVSGVRFKGNFLIYTNFALESGGLAFYLFKCDGGNFITDDIIHLTNEELQRIEEEASKRENIIYSSLP